MDAKPRLDAALVQEFVAKSHGDLDRVRALIQAHPALVNAAWDWGGGDWETGLGAAAHVGRRDIALFLLDTARASTSSPPPCSAISTWCRRRSRRAPTSIHVAGPHGIPLIAHAKAGGEGAAAVLAFLEERLPQEVRMTEAPAQQEHRARQAEKGAAFRALHQREGAFIIPNPFDAGHGAPARAPRLRGARHHQLGLRRDPRPARQHGGPRARRSRTSRVIAAATDLPVNGDLENGFGDAPEDAAETIRQGAAAGLSGGSIEDSTGRRDAPVYELAHAVERVRAAAEAAHSRPHPFTLTARAENLIVGRPDLADTIRRLQAYQEAGADVLYAPGLATSEDIATVVRSVDRPINVLIGMPGMTQSFEELQALGVKRISVGSAPLERRARRLHARGERDARAGNVHVRARRRASTAIWRRRSGSDTG